MDKPNQEDVMLPKNEAEKLGAMLNGFRPPTKEERAERKRLDAERRKKRGLFTLKELGVAGVINEDGTTSPLPGSDDPLLQKVLDDFDPRVY
jgi:hypothetical protein